MRATALLVAVLACVGCAPEPPEAPEETVEVDHEELGEGWTPDDAEGEGAAVDSGVPEMEPEDGDDECDDEGEACEVYEDGRSSCCNGRHTCFDAGCYYTEP